VRLSRERIGSRWSAFAARRSRRIRSFLKTFDLNNKSLSEIEQEEEDRARAIQLLQGDEYLFRDSFPFFLSPFRSPSVHPPPPPPPPRSSSSSSSSSFSVSPRYYSLYSRFPSSSAISATSCFLPSSRLYLQRGGSFHNSPSGNMCHLHYVRYTQVHK
jgi:hypothetical protein